MTKDEYWFWLCNIPGIYMEQIQKLLSFYMTPEDIFHADTKEMTNRQLVSDKNAFEIEKSRKKNNYGMKLEQLQKEGVCFLHPESPDYPEKLKMIPDPPYSLYVKGNLPDPDRPSVGMVGARACSEYGKKQALKFSEELALKGVQIVSGLATGIDSLSAKGALAGGGRTFAVLGSGVDVIYPMENFNLYYEILMSGGGIISEYPMGTQPIGWQFPYRNRLISGLSDRLLVMEAKERSGTLITVQYALAQGRDIFALPGRVTDRTSVGCNQLIADGAGILISPEYLLSEIFRKPVEKVCDGRPAKPSEPLLPPELKKIYDLFENDPVSIQYIIEKTQETPEKITFLLTELELFGWIREISKNNYVKIF